MDTPQWSWSCPGSLNCIYAIPKCPLDVGLEGVGRTLPLLYTKEMNVPVCSEASQEHQTSLSRTEVDR